MSKCHVLFSFSQENLQKRHTKVKSRIKENLNTLTGYTMSNCLANTLILSYRTPLESGI